jgi:serine/threonine protein kinase
VPAVGERQFGPYRLIRQIAVGGMAEIHLAKTAGIAGFEKYVALKMIHPNFAEDDQFIQMLVDEAKIAVQLTHGNIAQTFDLGRVGDTYYITMEYVDGADLYKILRRASEQDLAMPLDVCAFIGKEISSALDHAHRKRDHQGKSLGIVHRDVSPQNVLVSYSGEVKLVDFGIAKATMKVRQTAVGVIKGKYYYMSPEQAWGDPIDHRSDIFSAGIVLYEMITGQMLYLEEDLHKLLEMARSAEIAPPSKLRRGVPPQLERIVMHALAKVPGERYQSAGDFATDLERFLHAYSPVFTAPKLSSLLRDVVGDPLQVPDDPDFENIEFRDGVMSTHPLDDAEVARAIDRDSMRDENSVIFRMSELEKKNRAEASAGAAGPPPRPPSPPAPSSGRDRAHARPAPSSGSPKLAPRVTRATDAVAPPARPVPARPVPPGRPTAPAKIPRITKPREIDEDTRQLAPAAPANAPYDDGSGLLLPDGRKLPWDTTATDPGELLADEFDNIGERTQVTAAPRMSGFMMDVVGDDGDGPIEATLITTAPADPRLADATDSTAELRDEPPSPRELALEHPTLRARPKVKSSQPPAPPAALSANIHAPAVSELRKPRASRRTPPGGSPTAQPNVCRRSSPPRSTSRCRRRARPHR